MRLGGGGPSTFLRQGERLAPIVIGVDLHRLDQAPVGQSCQSPVQGRHAGRPTRPGFHLLQHPVPVHGPETQDHQDLELDSSQTCDLSHDAHCQAGWDRHARHELSIGTCVAQVDVGSSVGRGSLVLLSSRLSARSARPWRVPGRRAVPHRDDDPRKGGEDHGERVGSWRAGWYGSRSPGRVLTSSPPRPTASRMPG